MEFFESGFGLFLLLLGQVLAVTGFVMISLLFLVYGDRKIWGAVQMRRGPNVVGPWGLFQTVADFVKYVGKEIVIPAGADKFVFLLAPLLSFILALIAWAVVPFNEGWVVADLNVGILYLFAIGSLEVYGVIMGGWASNSKYPFLGSLRSAAQMISYEVSIGFIIIGIMISTGSLNLTAVVGVLWMVIKMLLVFFMFAMVKAVVPRYRYDQLMRLGWKVFLPMSLGWVVIVAFLAKYDVLGYARWSTGG